MENRTVLPLTLVNDLPLFINEYKLEPLKKEIENFLENESYMNSLIFSKKVLFSHEIQANNTIEGYNDDISIIESIIKETDNITDPEKRTRILNLYKGYKSILKNQTINQNSLKDLYAILSNNLLSEYDSTNMGEYYRKNPVYIYFSDNLSIEPNMGVDADKLDPLMNALFEYINTPNKTDSMTDRFIKSQIIHFYFVYLHPYYDINGRTGRTLSMWYLLNNKDYPFIIFNRGITLSKNRYYQIIRDVIKFRNLTFFTKYMLENVQLEFEKEYVMEALSQNSIHKLTSRDYQTLHSILSTNGLKTLSGFTYSYNLDNDKKKNKQIFEEMFTPLIDNGLLSITRQTNNYAFGDTHNFVYTLNYDKADIDHSKIKRLNLD